MATLSFFQTWNGDQGAANPTALSPITQRLSVNSGHLYQGATRFRVAGVAGAESACGYDDASERTGAPKRNASLGANMIRWHAFDNKKTPDGCWTTDTGADAYHLYDETYLTRMDEMISEYNNRGVYIWFCFDSDRRIAPGNDLATGTTNWAGLFWQADLKAALKVHYDTFLERTNTITGVKYKNNPGIAIWQMQNENGVFDTFFRTSGNYDTVVSGALDPWWSALNSKLAAYATSIGWTVPGTTFPLKATYNGGTWTNTDRNNFCQFLYSLENEYFAEMVPWFKAYNADILVCTSEWNYIDPRNAILGNVASRHNYRFEATGSAITFPYTSSNKNFMNEDTNGGYWSYSMSCRTPAVPLIISEMGMRPLHIHDYQQYPLEAILQCLHNGDGYCQFTMGQNKFLSTATGMTGVEVDIHWPSRNTSGLLANLIMRNGMISPLSTSVTSTIDPANIADKQRTLSAGEISAFRFASVSDGSEWGFLSKQVYTDFGTPQSLATFNAVKDADITSGIQVTSEVYIKNTIQKWSAPGTVGIMGTVDNISIGPMTTSGLGATYEGICAAAVLDDGGSLFTSRTLLLVHQYSAPTDATGFTTASPSGSTTSWGTEANTRINVPASFTVTFTSSVDMVVTGLDADGGQTVIAHNWSGTAVDFNTSTSYAWYLLTPVSITGKTSKTQIHRHIKR